MNKFRPCDTNTITIAQVVVWSVLICIYIIPSEIMLGSTTITKYIFLVVQIFLFFLIAYRVNKKELFLLGTIIICCLISSSLTPLIFLEIIVLERLINSSYKEKIKSYLNTNIAPLVAVIGCFVYSYLYKDNGRFANTAIGEINQSGLALLCLGLILYKRNKYCAYIIFLMGLSTFSRNYWVAILIILICNIKIIKTNIYKIKKLPKCYTLFFVSTIVLVAMGVLYQSLYLNGKITASIVGMDKMSNYFDWSNYFRFTANLYNVMMYIANPKLLITGVSDLDQYTAYCSDIAKKIGGLYHNNVPHNFIFAYLRLYGGFSFIIFYYIGKVINQLITRNNYGIFLAIMIYAIFLSTGFNTYWLFLSAFVLILYE